MAMCSMSKRRAPSHRAGHLLLVILGAWLWRWRTEGTGHAGLLIVLVPGRQPKDFVKVLRSLEDDPTRRERSLDVLNTWVNQSAAPNFLLQCMEEISDLLAPERSLAGLTAGLLVEFRPRWPRSSPKLRQKVLTISLKLWKQETCKATAIRLLEWFKVTEADVSNTTQRLALGAVCGELQTNGSDGEHLVLMLTRFPEIARGSGVTAERVIDGMAQRGYLKPAILVAERMNVTNKIRQLKGRLMDACVKGEGKEIGAIIACDNSPRKRVPFVKKLLKAGKLRLALERIDAWNLDIVPSEKDVLRSER
ncbi:Exonuclease mut-7-like, partial [Durusdinium trenchii]